MDARLWHRSYDPQTPVELPDPGLVLPQLLENASSRFPSRDALDFFGFRLTYRQFQDQVWRAAQGLAALGVRKGGRVGLALPNTPHAAIAYYGALAAGAVVVQDNPLYSEEEFKSQINDSGTEVLVVLDRLFPKIERIRSRTGLRHVIVARVEDYLPWHLRGLLAVKNLVQGRKDCGHAGPGTRRWADLLASGRPADPRVPLSPDDLALLQYTGGTTGVSKGVMLTHRNLIANVQQARSWMPDLRDGEETMMAVLPFFHVYGMTICMNLAVLTAGRMVLLPQFQVREVLRAVERTRPTVFPGVPSMYAVINSTRHVERVRLSSIRACISGAGPLSTETSDRFEALTGGTLVEGYGLTEASPVTHCNLISGKRKAGSIGLPLPGTDARIMDPETGTRELSPGEVGELVVKGPQVMQGYWKRDDETARVLRDGWLWTGDLAKMDDEGFFFIMDRKKDLIKCGGENVFPRMVEEVLNRHPQVRESAVIGVPDKLHGEVVKAIVVLKEASGNEQAQQADVRGIHEYCRQHLAKFEVPRVIEIRPEIPEKNMLGKVLKRKLREEERKRQDGGTLAS